jgi:hypothetical protein
MSKKDIILWLFSAVLIIFIAYILIGGIHKKKSLDSNMEYYKAVISGFSTGPGLRYYLDYEFNLGSNLYQGSGKHYPKSDTLSVGDTIFIVYDKTNPNNNRPYRDYE